MRRRDTWTPERDNRSRATLVGALALGLLAIPATGYSLVPVRELWVPNGPVRAMAHANNTVYLGGEFSLVGPALGPVCSIDLVTAVAQAPSLHIAGDPGGPCKVDCVKPDGLGGWYLGGLFTSIEGQPRKNLAHMDPNGTVSSWNPGVNGEVIDIEIGGGVVYVVGYFTTVGAASRNQVAAIDAVTGEVTPWDPVHDNYVNCVEVGGGKVYLAGSFTTISGQPRQCLAEFTAVVPGDPSTGALTGFLTLDPLYFVEALKLDGNTLFVADFDNVHIQNNLFVHNLTADTLRYGMAVGGDVRDIAVDQANGTFFVGGDFTWIAGVQRFGLAAIDLATGAPTSWSVDPGSVWSLDVAHVNGVDELVVAGDFTSIGGAPRRGVAIVDPQLPTVLGWNAACDGSVHSVKADGTKIYAAGDFTIMNGVPRSNLAAIDETTGAALSWNPSTNGIVHALAVSGNTVYVGGEFTSVNGTTRNHAAGVDAGTGALTVFNPNPDNTVRALAVGGGLVYMGGDFTVIRLADHASLAAVNPTTGVALSSWIPYTDGSVYALLFIPGGISSPIVIVGGAFTVASGALRSNLASLDTQTGAALPLNPGPNGLVRSLAFTPTSIGGYNDLYLGGDFTLVGGQPRNHIADLISFGVAPDWDPNANGPVYSMVTVGSSVFVGGEFDTIGGQTRHNIATIGNTGAATMWDPFAVGSTVPTVTAVLENAGILYAGGNFTSVSGSRSGHFAGLYDMVSAVPGETAPKARPLALRVTPNPFDQSTEIRFSLPVNGDARVTVYDVAGRRTREIHRGWLPSGHYALPWDGRDDSGRSVATGIYLVRVKTQAGSTGFKVYRVK